MRTQDDRSFDSKSALAFVVSWGIVSLLADMTYEGMRGISGPYLAMLGASAAAVGVVAGTGEMTGYLLRLFSGRLVERTGAYWLITLIGYVVQMMAVPLMAFAGSWWMAAVLIVIERAGKAIRNPAANSIMSRAGEHIGQGWAFGLKEAMDQCGAMAGPLIAAWVLARHHDYRLAFLWLGVPAVLTVMSVVLTSMRFDYAGRIPVPEKSDVAGGLSRAFWLYMGCAALFALGFADYALIAYHYSKSAVFSAATIPILYAAAMAASGLGALVFGRWFDRRGLSVLFPAIVLAALAPPLMFLAGPIPAVIGTMLWGLALGVQDAIMSAAVAHLVGQGFRARAYGLFSAIYGVAWFIGSAAMGGLYDVSLTMLVIVSSLAQLLALYPLWLAVRASDQRVSQ